MDTAEHEELLAFWFGAVDADGRAPAQASARWWRGSEEFDELCRARFGELYRAVRAGERDAWLAAPRSRLAYVLVLDQLSRNLFRGTAAMYGADEDAFAAAAAGVAEGVDAALFLDGAAFLYLPYVHQESLACQEEAVARFAALRDRQPTPALRAHVEGFHAAAVAHRDIVARFGRFPHRNAILGRPSSPEEEAFLRQPGSSF